MFYVNLYFVGFSCLFYLVYAERCFHCTNIPDPSNCTTVETCGPDQMCSIRQFVASDGSVLYSTQCLDKTRCGTLSHIAGKRHSEERAIDITTCYECCDQDFCNNQGCTTKAVPRDQRGPYCYTCDASLDPKACSDISICKENEQCIVFVSPELSSTSQIVYKSTCESKAACASLSHIFGNSSCPPFCCDQDFCNADCQQVVPATSIPVVCDTAAGYQLIQDVTGNTSLCVQIHTDDLNWDSARAACIAAGGDLVILDASDKDILLRKTLDQEHKYSHHNGYWIGAKDFDLTNTFRWVNNNTVINGEWDRFQPNHHDGGHDQNCVAMWNDAFWPFLWHAEYCPNWLGYICQQA